MALKRHNGLAKLPIDYYLTFYWLFIHLVKLFV